MFVGDVDAVARVGGDATVAHAFVEEEALAFAPEFALVFVANGGGYCLDRKFSFGFQLFYDSASFRCLQLDEPFGCLVGSVVVVKGFGGNEGFVRPKKEAEPASAGNRKEERPAYEPSSSFGTILERYAASPKEKTFEEYMKEKGDDEKRKETLTLSRLRTMPPQSTLDLHGYTAKEAESAVRSFLSECHDNGIRKISIITGKGLHSEDGVGVLKSTVQAVLDESGLVSEKASAPLSAGGSGALWIILKA